MSEFSDAADISWDEVGDVEEADLTNGIGMGEAGHSLPAVTEIHASVREEEEAKAPRKTKRFYACMGLLGCFVLALAFTVVVLGFAFSGEKAKLDQAEASSTGSSPNEIPSRGSPSNEIPSGGSPPNDIPSGGSPPNDIPSDGSAPDDIPSDGSAPDDIPSDGSAPDDIPSGGSAPNDVPAAAPTSMQATRFNEIVQLLGDGQISSTTALMQSSTPQNVAAQWISYQQTVPIPEVLGSDEGYDFLTLYVLTLFHYATGGPTWDRQAEFLRSTNFCQWRTISLLGTFTGVACNTDNKVVALALINNNLSGSLPTELGHLTSMQYIILDRNSIQGEIPDSFQQLTSLKELHMGQNFLEGNFPSYIGALSNLEAVDLSWNYLGGTLPPSLGNLEELSFFAVDRNQIEGDVGVVFGDPQKTGLKKLSELYLENNLFKGALDSNFLKNAEDLYAFDISDNEFSGVVPAHFFEFPKLVVLDIHDNNFTAFPDPIPENSKLLFVAAQKNMFKSAIPDTIGRLQGLSHLDLSQNEFTGNIPPSIGGLKNLTYLFLSENDFTAGPIPEFLGNLEKLEELSLKASQLTGPIPDFIGNNLTQLMMLDLDDNALVGQIPKNFGNLTKLRWLLLNRNRLEGEIPAEFSKLPFLELFFLEENDITSGLEVPCSIDPFGAQQSLIIADCDLCDAQEGCCIECCSPDKDCSDRSHVPDMDPFWQVGYRRVSFTVSKEDWFSP